MQTHIQGLRPQPYRTITVCVQSTHDGVCQPFFGHFEKKLKAKKTQAEKKLKQIFEKLKQIIQKLNNLPTKN